MGRKYRWRDWTDVTVSRCRRCQTLTHFHSARHKRPAAFVSLGTMLVDGGRVTFFKGSRIPLFAFDVRPPSAMCLHVCAFVCQRGLVRGHIHVCGFEKQRSETVVAPETAPSSFLRP